MWKYASNKKKVNVVNSQPVQITQNVNILSRKNQKELNEICPECGNKLIERVGRYWEKFISCSNYPDCKYIKKKIKKIIYNNQKNIKK
ncbi:MAG: topoisomerase DNA-binding C4 zinc finger domain-containing protein [Clostridium sp.]|nr:MAG: topoisomerase DNA-binding C4 zinc finger domain-containing protein [Clostridium sp.]